MSLLINPFISFPTGGGGGDETALDFLAGSYVVNGGTVTAADIVDHPEWVGASGLELNAVANAIGELLTLLLTANWTIVLEWNHGTASGEIYPFVVSDGGSRVAADNVVRIRRLSGSHYLFIEDYAGAGYRGVADSFAFGNGTHKIALTRTHDKLVFSADGRALATGDTDDFTLAATAATFGGFVGDTLSDTIYIRSLTVLAPQDDSLLPALSA